MNLPLVELAKKQYALDRYIREQNHLAEPQLLMLANAFFVEISEFLNEVRAFKDWSKKGIDKEKAYEEYADGLHFLLSIANDRWDIHRNEPIGEQFEREVTRLLNNYKGQAYDETDEASTLQFITHTMRLYSTEHLCESNFENFIGYMCLYLQTGYMVGMSNERILGEYERKHEINYGRHASGQYK